MIYIIIINIDNIVRRYTKLLLYKTGRGRQGKILAFSLKGECTCLKPSKACIVSYDEALITKHNIYYVVNFTSLHSLSVPRWLA